MELWGTKTQRAIIRLLCAIAVGGWGASVGAEATPTLSSGVLQDAFDAADLADAYLDSPVLRALSAAQVKASVDKTAVADIHAVTGPKPANATATSKQDPVPLGVVLQGAVKDLAVQTGAVDAKHFLSDELGLDKSADVPVDADTANSLRRRPNGDADIASNAPPRSAEQIKQDGVQASILASALVQEVVPWAVGFFTLLGCVQGLRLMMAFSQRKTERKRKRRKASSGGGSLRARL